MIYQDNKQVITEYKKILLDQGIKQQDIAAAMGMSKQAFCNYLKKKNLSFQDAQRLAAAAGYDLHFEFIKRQD